MWYVYTHIHTHTHARTMEYYSATKMDETMSFSATWMDLEIILRYISQKRTNYHMVSSIHGIQKNIQMNSFTKQK